MIANDPVLAVSTYGGLKGSCDPIADIGQTCFDPRMICKPTGDEARFGKRIRMIMEHNPVERAE